MERHLRRLGGIDLLHAQIDSAIRTGRQASLDLFLHKYGALVCLCDVSAGFWALEVILSTAACSSLIWLTAGRRKELCHLPLEMICMLHALGHNSLEVSTLAPTAGIARCSAEAQQAEHCIVSAGSSMINALGAEVDRLEADVAKLCPGIRHIDLVSILSTGVSPPAVFMPHYQSLLLPASPTTLEGPLSRHHSED